MKSISVGYKQTEVGVIPTDWKLDFLGQKASIFRGGSPRPIESYITTSSEGVNWIKIGDVSANAKYIKSTSEKIIASGVKHSREVKAGDLLLSNSMSYGRPYILCIDGCIHDGWLTISNYEHEFEKEFLCYILGSECVSKQYSELAAGTGVKNLNKQIVGKVQVPYPASIDEQRAISTALSDMDALIEAKTSLLEKKRAIKQGSMQELLTGLRRLPGFPATPMKKTDIGEIPEDWMVYELGAIGSWLKGQPMSKGDIALDGKYECIHYGEIFTVYKEVIRNTVSKTNIKQKKTSQIGDIIFAASDVTPNGLARCSSVMLDGVIYGSDIIILRVKAKSMCSMFVSYSINYNKAQLIDRVTGTTVKHINSRDLSSVKIALPRDKEEQHEIALILSDMDAEIEILEHELKKLRDIKQGMMQELLTGRIRLVK